MEHHFILAVVQGEIVAEAAVVGFRSPLGLVEGIILGTGNGIVHSVRNAAFPITISPESAGGGGQLAAAGIEAGSTRQGGCLRIRMYGYGHLIGWA
jgi:hypothetical protein